LQHKTGLQCLSESAIFITAAKTIAPMASTEMNTSARMQYVQEQIALNNQQAFRQLFDYYAPRLIHFAFVIVRHYEVAVELVDDVFIKIWKRRGEIMRIGNIRVYLYTAVKNTSLNYLAKKAHELVTEPFDFMNIDLREAINPEQETISNEILREINKAIESLPPRCKMIFKLVRQDGLKYREVAVILNVSEKTVDAQMVIAVKRISERVINCFNYFPATRKGE
jgi:RNA polymerase sigma-70 factor (family 1)